MPITTVFDTLNDTDSFGVVTLSGLVSGEPYTPGQVGKLGIFEEDGVPTTDVAFDLIDGVLTLVGPTPRGGPGETVAKDKGRQIKISVDHWQRDDAIMADELQNRRRLGSADSVETLQNMIVKRSMKHFRDYDATLEHQRLGALRGIVLDKNGNTRLNLFTTFDVVAQAVVNLDLDNASPASGALRTLLDTVIETVENSLGADSYDHVHALAGRSAYRALMAHKEVVDSYKNTILAAELRKGLPPVYEFGNVMFERYRTGGAASFIADDEVHFFPVGVPGLFKTYFGPADYNETVNTDGLPRYVKPVRMDNDKGVRLEVQTNPLSICQKPRALITGTLT